MVIIIEHSIREVTLWTHRAAGAPSVKKVATMNTGDFLETDLMPFIRTMCGERETVTAFAFCLVSGGDLFPKPVRITRRAIDSLARLAPLFPLYMNHTRALFSFCLTQVGPIPMFMFSETAFFKSLPDEERYYAIPYEYSEANRIKRWGYHGLLHEDSSALFPETSQVLSIVLDRQTTVCAIKNMTPRYISMGYTPLEGIMGKTTCGDLDPGAVFYLMKAHNLSMYRIDDILSGFFGMTGRRADINELYQLNGKDRKVTEAFNLYFNQILQHTGEGMALLGSLDGIVFSGRYVSDLQPLVFKVLKKLSFMGLYLRRLPWKKAGDRAVFVHGDTSRIKACLNFRTKQRIMGEATVELLKRA